MTVNYLPCNKNKLNFTLITVLFCLLLFIIRFYLRGYPLELDEAEQWRFARELHLGYGGQPPLYSWLQWLVFQITGNNLLGLALLKYSLLGACWWSYYQLCRYYCPNPDLAWCAWVSWALIPTIGYDLIKDNTHSVLVLLMACLTWQWLYLPRKINSALLACIIAAGLLSKFNYGLFLAIALLTSSLKRQNLTKLLVIGILVMLITSSYLFWLVNHAAQGFGSAYKLQRNDQSFWHGLGSFYQALLLFCGPILLLLHLFFPILKTTARARSLLRYHLLAVPLLSVVIIISGIGHVQTRWLIPLFFLWPLLYFSLVDQERDWGKQARLFLILCIVVQAIYLVILEYRALYGHQAMRSTDVGVYILPLPSSALPGTFSRYGRRDFKFFT